MIAVCELALALLLGTALTLIQFSSMVNGIIAFVLSLPASIDRTSECVPETYQH